MPLVSVVTCTFNRAHLIAQTIESVLGQTFQDFEYIIVDDGSEDETKKVIDSFNDHRIKYFAHERTGGHLSRLRNFAHTKCAGEFIGYVDSDDLWEKSKLEKQVNVLLKDSTIGFSFTDVEIFNEEKILRSGIYQMVGTFTGSVFPAMLRNELIICHTTLLVRKSCLNETGPMDETMHSGDHDLVFVLSRLFTAYVVYAPLVRVRKHEQNSTSNNILSLKLLKEHHRTLEKLLKKKLISSEEYQGSVAITSYSFGVQLLQMRDCTSAIDYFLKGLKIRPWHLKSWAQVMRALAKQKLRF